MWTTIGPGVGVKTAIGAPKLELQAKQIMRRAKETGKSPEQVRDELYQGLEHWMVPAAAVPAGATLFNQFAAPEVPVY
jgi:hypothetical protein